MNVHTRAFPIASLETGADRSPAQGAQRIRIMTGQVARDGDIVDPLGMDTEEYLRNPVVLWVHDSMGRSPSAGLPIGRTLDLKRRPDGIEVEFEFLANDPFAERVRNAWAQGFLRTASMSWQSFEVQPLPGGNGLRHTRTNLIEWSLAPVPVDPGASRGAEYTRALRSLGLAEVGDSLPPRHQDAKGEEGGGPTAAEEALGRFVKAARELRETVRQS